MTTRTHEEIIADHDRSTVNNNDAINDLINTAQANWPGDDSDQMRFILRQAIREIRSADEALVEFAACVTFDPIYSVKWADKVVTAGFNRNWYLNDVVKAFAKSTDTEEVLGWLAQHMENLNEATLEGRYEERSTSALSRAAGELQMDAARMICRYFGALVRHAVKEAAKVQEGQR